MRRFFFAVLLAVACATSAAAGPYEDAASVYDRGDYTRAARLLRLLAEQGDAQAQSKLGLMYARGQGVPQDFIRAYMWYTFAAAAVSVDERKAAMKKRRRDDMALRMTAAQIEKAQEMARRCQATKFKECD
ncbi:MAG: SEL1-like repeat protein [Nitrospirota bacterium]